MAKVGPPPRRSTKGAPPGPAAQRPANLERPAPGESTPLNFKVPVDFHQRFKIYAATHRISMLELLIKGFELVQQREP